MLTYEDALKKILAAVSINPAESRPLLDCLDAVLGESVVSPVALPPFTNSAMDGYAVRAADTAGASADSPVTLCMIEEMATGRPAAQPVRPGAAIKINTGSPLPEGADAIVPVEDTNTPSAGEVEILAPAEAGSFLRYAGEDVAAGSTVLAPGSVVGPSEVAMAAAVGRSSLSIIRAPRVAIIATGSELVDPGSADLAPGQIYNSNSFALAAQVMKAGGEVVALLKASDTPDALRAAFDYASDADIVITSGGVSVGGYDLVKDIVAERGNVDFWRVSIRPGKPFAFGQFDQKLFFGLPGNPVSSMVTFELFVRPAFLKMRGLENWQRRSVEAKLLETVEHGVGRQSFMRAVTLFEDGAYITRPAGAQGSHLLRPMVEANSLLILPADLAQAPAGSFVTVMMLD